MGRKKTVKSKRFNNEGSIQQLPNGKWRCQLSLGYKDDGKRNRPSEVFDTEEEAVAWKTKMLATAQEYGKESVKVISDSFVDKYKEWLLSSKRFEVYSPTFSRMMSEYKKHIAPYFNRFKLKDLTKEVFQKFFVKLEQQGVGQEARRKMRGTLRQYFEKEYENSPMRNPLEGIHLKTKKQEKILNPHELILIDDYKAVPKKIRTQFLEALDNEKHSRFLKPMCYLMYFSGNRVGETLAYQWQDFNFEQRYFIVYKAVSIEYEFDEEGERIGKSKTVIKAPKTKKGVRPLPLIDILYECLMEWYEYRKLQEKMTGISFTAPTDYIFATSKGELRSRWGANSIFARFLKRHGLHKKGIHFHALRQTFSNSLFAEESEEKMITDLMGHTKIETSKEHYNSIEKFDSVQKAARMFNSKFKPKNAKYCATEEVTFAPEGYLNELEPVLPNQQNRQETSPSATERKSLKNLLDELCAYPEFKELIKQLNDKKETENEAE